MNAAMRQRPVPAPVSGGHLLGGGRTAVMGVLNVTPDSFSDGGSWVEPRVAIDHALEMYDQGALIVDVGGESTRPGAARVPAEEEWRRIAPILASLTRRGLPVSVDTVHAETARRAAQLGAAIINDVSGGLHEPEIVDVAAEYQVALVIQHWRGFPSDPSLDQQYRDVAQDVLTETLEQTQRAIARGVPNRSVIIDPGLGFAKNSLDSWALVDSLEMFTQTRFPVLVGASRKRFVADRYGADVDRGTVDVTERAVLAGAWAVRVHQVGPSVAMIEELS